ALFICSLRLFAIDLRSTLDPAFLFASYSLAYPLFFFDDTAPTEIHTLSLHDALPISHPGDAAASAIAEPHLKSDLCGTRRWRASDRKSTRLNSSHGSISYAVFCLKKKKKAVVDNTKITNGYEMIETILGVAFGIYLYS